MPKTFIGFLTSKFSLLWFKWRLNRKKIKCSKIKRPQLNYGDIEKNTSRMNFGGGVKLKTLAKKYPEHEFEFNILYLVSSCLPKNIDLWVDKCKKNGIKIVWNQNGVAYPAWAGRFTDEINSRLKVLHKADFVVYQSQFCKKSADKYLGKFDGPSIVVYNPVDTNLFKPQRKVRKDGAIRLMVAGSHHEKERVMLALEALKILIQQKVRVRLIIAGRLKWKGADREVSEYVSVNNLGNKVSFLGEYQNSKAVKIYQRADILLHLKYNDPCPTVVLEAMACGIPVIGSDSGGLPELLGDKGGTLIEVPSSYSNMHYPNADQVAEKVLNVMKDKTQLSRLFRKRTSQFEGRKWLRTHQQIFNSLLK